MMLRNELAPSARDTSIPLVPIAKVLPAVKLKVAYPVFCVISSNAVIPLFATGVPFTKRLTVAPTAVVRTL